MSTEQIIKQMPDKVQFIIKAPHFVVNQGTVYWQKNLMDKDVVEPVINLIEGGINKEKINKAKLETKVRDIREKNEKLEKELAAKDSEIEELNRRLKNMRSAHDSFTTEAEMLLE